MLAATSIAACGGPSKTPEQKAQASKNRAQAESIWSTRKPVNVNGRVFNVGVSPTKKFALVWPQNAAKPASIIDFEKAAGTASGCVGKDTSVLSFLTGDRNTPLPISKIKANYIRISLTC